MATLPKESNFTPAPAGPHPAICYGVIDLGTQESNWQGKVSRKHKVRIVWELFCDERMDDGRPFSVSKSYTWSTGKKATLRKDLESWRGLAFKDGDFGPGGFDIKNLLGAACLLSVVHKDTNGDVYANVDSVMKLPKTMTVGRLTNEKVYLWLSHDEFDKDAFMKLSERMREKIITAPEYKAAITGEDVEIEGLNPGHDPDDADPNDPPF